MSEHDNPLVRYQFNVPFDAITPSHVEPAVDALLARSRERLSTIKQQQGPRSYDDTLGAFDAATEELEHAMSIVSHLESVATNQALRDAYNAVQPKVSAFYAGISLDADLYRAIKEYGESAEAKKLDPARARFLKTTLDDFRRHGAELDGAEKTRMSELSVELSRLTTEFSQHLLDATGEFEVVFDDATRLAGLPESALEAARESARTRGRDGAYRFTLQQPSYVAVLTYADDAAFREQLYRAYNTRATQAPHDNPALIRQILALRSEKAKLLGFANFADLNLEDRMARRGEAARAFVADLQRATEAAFKRENDELRAFRRELEGEQAAELQPWDIGYYAEKLRKARFDFDQEELRPYFSVDGVLNGMFQIVERIYGITVARVEDVATYHSDVRYYTVRDEDGAEIGAFFADLYPRDEKRGGAWMADFITSVPGGTHPRHLGVMCANASPPVGGKPALLTHSDVETLFHEFGHLLHHLLGKARVRSLAGTRVAWDFVELPSMIMENFCWERAALDLFARHYQTDEGIPTELLEKLRRTRTYRAANAQMRQLGFAALDLALHIDYDPQQHGDVMGFARGIMQVYSPAPLTDDYAMIAGFSHLFSSPVGYAAGYYSYKWAEVLEADAFSRFAQAGVFSRDVGRAFREHVLARGNEADPMELVQAFLGRAPSSDALLKRAGLWVHAA